MSAFSMDLRERIVALIDRGEHSLREIARLLSVSLSCLVRLLQLRRRTGSIKPRPHGGGRRRKLNVEDEERLRELVRQSPDATLAELRDRLGVPCGLMTIVRALQRLRISRKKKSLHAQEQDTPQGQAQRAAFDETMQGVDPEKLVFVDEVGANTSMTRTYGRGPIGERVGGAVPGHWENVTLIVGLRSDGVIAPMAFTGATDAAAFEAYVEQVLTPELKPGDVVVWDNLRVHKDPQALAAVEGAKARVLPLPPYSPDKNPIEEMFSKVKQTIRSIEPRTPRAVIDAMGRALKDITTQDITGWFKDRCAYAFH